MLPIRKSYVDVSNGRLHVRSCGTGTQRPLLCFHLSPSSDVVFEQFMKAAGRDRLVVAPDTPGFGMSDTPATAPGIPDYARVMGELADNLKIEEFDVVGIHAGSAMAAELGLQRPQQVRHIIMAAAPVFYADELAQFRSQYGPKVQAAFNYHLANTLPRLQPPVLILNANDDLTQQTRRAASYLANGQILELPEWGNGFFDDHTNEVDRLVREFTA
jgi:pimeloyl-ACP methyl ester carboxylesterase